MQAANNFGCFFCKGSGAIVAIKRTDGCTYAFRCSCNAYADRNKCYALWSEILLKKFSPDYKNESLTSIKEGIEAYKAKIKKDPEEIKQDIKPHSQPVKSIQKQIEAIENKPLPFTEDDIPF